MEVCGSEWELKVAKWTVILISYYSYNEIQKAKLVKVTDFLTRQFVYNWRHMYQCPDEELVFF